MKWNGGKAQAAVGGLVDFGHGYGDFLRRFSINRCDSAVNTRC
jgi:hypothetical protein